MNQFIATAVAEKIASLATMEYFEQSARRGDKHKIRAVLAKAPKVESDLDDQLSRG
jgi:hypothetical protein